MKIGFIGFGEAAYNIALGLGGAGIAKMTAFDVMQNHEVMGRLVKNRTEEAGVMLQECAIEVVKNSDLIFSAVPSSYALEVCGEIKEVLNADKIYADVSASTPAIKEKIWEEVKDTGVLFIDAAMLGSLPKDKHRVPITASGNGAEIFKEKMTPYGMDIQTAGTKAGAASAIKLVRSIYMKGIASLMIEMLQAADAYEVSEEVISSIARSMDPIPFTDHLNRLVTGSAIHCVRRAAELNGSITMLEECGLSQDMTTAAKTRLSALEKYEFSKRYLDKKPEGWKEIIDVMKLEK